MANTCVMITECKVGLGHHATLGSTQDLSPVVECVVIHVLLESFLMT